MGVNIYEDLVPYSAQDTTEKTILSFFNVAKYPPSLLYLCITMGPALFFLHSFENKKNILTDFFLIFGRVPLFYYFLHVLLIHVLAIVGMMILNAKSFMQRDLAPYGYLFL